MKHNKYNERVANLKDEIKALSDNLDWALRLKDTLSASNDALKRENYRIAKLARHNSLVLVLMGIMLDLCKDNSDVTVANTKDAILNYYKAMAQIITLPEETLSDDDEETYE